MIGFLNVIKPTGITSHDLISKIRKLAGIKKVGHAGTLDPLAQGVMVVALGSATRLIQYVPGDKTYLADMLLGLRTDTDDTQGKTLEKVDDLSHLSVEQIERSLLRFSGKQQQIPPIYSAIKQGGMKMYELARRGEAPSELKARSVEIYSIDPISIEPPSVSVRVRCSKGTYIRSIARDLGAQLGVGGCLAGLVREQSGLFRIDASHTLASLTELKEQGKLDEALIDPHKAIGLPLFTIDLETARKLAHGQSVSALPEAKDYELFMVGMKGSPVAIALMKRQEDGSLRPEVVLRHAAEL
ncbi:MAG: tRNA pseudouridine(55) synthase TruB [Candidatus Obscuribacterales bacterium]|nr:tRNA pseudouridine(55) synthase TruB [Candidatus Obscuribacterales bacterium]